MVRDLTMILHKKDWEALASTDPLWAICSDDSKRGGRWDLAEFFETGCHETQTVMTRAAKLGLPKRHDSCLDFGCGVGRITRAFASYFGESIGIDLSANMIQRAKTLTPQCTFEEAADFAFPESRFDLIYCSLVLQHQPSAKLALDYVGKFLKMLAPGGLIVFQMPSYIPFKHRLQPRRRLYRALRLAGIGSARLLSLGINPIRMIAITERTMIKYIEQRGAQVLAIHPCQTASGVTGNYYYVSR
jgi:SAM-dependent methyltransferase